MSVVPEPRELHAEPSQLAMRFAGPAPVAVKLPPAKRRSLLMSKARDRTSPLTPDPRALHAEPSQAAILFAGSRSAEVKKPPARMFVPSKASALTYPFTPAPSAIHDAPETSHFAILS